MKITGKQLTAMVVAGCAAVVLMPVSVSAVGSAVNIVDASGTKARVFGGALMVNDDPAASFSKYGEVQDDGSSALVIANPRANVKVSLGSVTLSNSIGPSTVRIVIQQARPAVSGNCYGSTSNLGYPLSISLAPGETQNIVYSPRLALPKKTFETCVLLYANTFGGPSGGLLSNPAGADGVVTVDASGVAMLRWLLPRTIEARVDYCRGVR